MQGYAVSKTLVEKAASIFAKENNISLITINPGVRHHRPISNSRGPSNRRHSSVFAHRMIRGMYRGDEKGHPMYGMDSTFTSRWPQHSFEDIARNEVGMNFLKSMQLISGSISIVHVEDVCRAHIFVAEDESASGRCICCAANTRVPDLAKFLSKRYPPYNVVTDFSDFLVNLESIISSEKLIKAGFSYNYGMEEMYDESVEYLRAVGLLAN